MSEFETIVSNIISDTPPGEIRDVYDSLITIAGEQAKETILAVIEQYNVENNIPVTVDSKDVVLSKHGKTAGSKFYDPIESVAFSVDHLTRQAFNIEPYRDFTPIGEDLKAIIPKLESYTETNYPGDVTFGVYPVVEDGSNSDINEYEIIIVSTKYNPGNFWGGHWKSRYIYDVRGQQLVGEIAVNVHYYEDGNVTFKSSKDVSLSDVSVANIVNAIAGVEEEFEKNLDRSFEELNEKQFKSLRRRLPVTRAKVNWGRPMGNYRLGRDAAQGSR